MVPEYFKHEMDEKRAIVDRYAAAARVIALHLREFCDESLPYDEMIADAARRVAEELATWKQQRDLLRAALVGRWRGRSR